MSQRNGSIRKLGLLQCNNQTADIVEINYVFSIENSNQACTNAEDLDVKNLTQVTFEWTLYLAVIGVTDPVMSFSIKLVMNCIQVVVATYSCIQVVAILL